MKANELSFTPNSTVSLCADEKMVLEQEQGLLWIPSHFLPDQLVYPNVARNFPNTNLSQSFCDVLSPQVLRLQEAVVSQR